MLTRRDFLGSVAMAAGGMLLPKIKKEPDKLLGHPIEYVDNSPLNVGEIVLGDPYQSLYDALRELLPDAERVGFDHRFDGLFAGAFFFSAEVGKECYTGMWLSCKLMESADIKILAPFVANEMRAAFQDAEHKRLAKGDYVI